MGQNLDNDTMLDILTSHWETWITEDDIKEIASLGLNAVRIPVGYWMYEDIIQEGEYWPRGGIWHLDRIVGLCKKYGIYVLIGLHSGPGISSPNEQFTGHVCILYLVSSDFAY